jgi:hypothetical protein
MSRKTLTDSSDEYLFLKNKVLKTLTKASEQGPIALARAKRQCKKFINKMKQIEYNHRKLGYPHPEAKFMPKRDLQRELDQSKQKVGKQPLANPDGSLYQKEALIESGAGFVISNKGVVKPDGTLFETPVMDGAVLNPAVHSEDSIKRYLEERDDSFLRVEE